MSILLHLRGQMGIKGAHSSLTSSTPPSSPSQRSAVAILCVSGESAEMFLQPGEADEAFCISLAKIFTFHLNPGKI